jgi:hypothetical protein
MKKWKQRVADPEDEVRTWVCDTFDVEDCYRFAQTVGWRMKDCSTSRPQAFILGKFNFLFNLGSLLRLGTVVKQYRPGTCRQHEPHPL